MALRREDLLTDWQARLPATVDATTARLPAYYEAAKDALERCVQLDEVKHWSDRAAALASYARQANDQSLRVMAQRIHLRAVARIGELLIQIPAAKGGHDRGRFHAAREAGLSSRKTTSALAVARIPRAKREAVIEADEPPSVRSLERMAPPSSDTPAHTFKVSTDFYRILSRDNGSLFTFCSWLLRVQPSGATELTVDERSRVLERIGEAQRWLAKLEQEIVLDDEAVAKISMDRIRSQ